VLPFSATDPLMISVDPLVVPVRVSALIVPPVVVPLRVKSPVIVPLIVGLANVPPVVVPLRVKLPLNVPLIVGDTSVVFVPVPAFFNINDDDIDPMFAVDVQKSEDAPTESVDPLGLIFRG
jgi:hypothetical protein